MSFKFRKLISNFKRNHGHRNLVKLYIGEPKRIALKISITYILIGALWIIISDILTGYYFNGKETITLINLLKGEMFVLITGILVYFLIYRELRRTKIIEDELIRNYEDITKSNLELEKAYNNLSSSKSILKQQYEQIVEGQQKFIEYEEKLTHLAYHDQVTGLKNTRSMKECFNTLVNENSEKISLLYIDIDNFKYINDTLGHSFGDLLLISISERLDKYQKGNCNLYRLGGDEYIILFNGYDGIGDVEKLAVKILKEFNNSFEIEKINLFIKISMGISIYPEHGNCIDEMLKNADIAVHKAKEMGKNRIIIYNQPMNEAITERVIIEKQLRTALHNNEFELFYQPQLDIKENRITGFEALIRWRNPELGLVSPNRFIGIAEATHLIIPIGEWVLRNACIFLRRMHLKGYKDISISINVSILQLLQDDFVDMVLENMDLVGIDPKHLELEITESVLMESYEAISSKLKMLRASGIRIALDDFGKGYSSLNYLGQLPITTLKIDKLFVDTILIKTKNKSLIDLIVKIGKSMDLCVIAEGVETKEQLEYLIKHKCNKIQGYYFSKPLPEREALNLMEKNIKDINETQAVIENGKFGVRNITEKTTNNIGRSLKSS